MRNLRKYLPFHNPAEVANADLKTVQVVFWRHGGGARSEIVADRAISSAKVT
uniref:Uncharacterized protein n=1 Tax=Magnetospirillum gryphiswaldense TaxID=55518 RepID=A4TWM0_9PROT|nr:hypothetical protein MGR_0743 [Magnetospirillum gryphiswaldense MSR-1]